MNYITNKARLCELIYEAEQESTNPLNGLRWGMAIEDYVANYLDKHGVIVPPCKVGDTVYTIHRANFRHNWKPYVDEQCVTEINQKCDRNGKDIGWGVVLYSIENHTTTRYKMSNVGKTVFLSREEAEAALKGVNNDN